MRRALLALLLVTPALVGCLGGSDDALDPSAVEDPLGPDAPATAWASPQTTPHPAYGFPTVNDPARGLDEPGAAPAWWAPPAPTELPDTITGLAHQATVDDGVERGAGIALFGQLAIATGLSDPTTLWDIGDPSAPERLADLPGPPSQDAYTIAYPDGRLVAVLAPNAASLPIVDITDPGDPELLTIHDTERFVHNLGRVPGTPVVYTASSSGGGALSGIPGREGSGATEIYDLSDPSEPRLVQDWANGYGCHEITFHIDPARELYRAYCAGLQMTQIWDITDPLKPEVVVEIPMPHDVPEAPSAGVIGGMVSHLAMANHDASVLIVGDETALAFAPTCDAYAHAAGTTVSGPLGNLWFYDISDETQPELLSWISPNTHLAGDPPHDDRPHPTDPLLPGQLSCTAHFATLIGETGLIAVGYLKGGLVLVDITDPANPRIVDQFTQERYVWDVWYYQGYLFTGDYHRGMDVFTLAG